MEIDIKILVIIAGIMSIIEALVIFHQYRINKVYKGMEWWLLWTVGATLSFGLLFLLNVPSLFQVTVILQSLIIIASALFFYFGIKRFFDRPLNWKLLIPVLSVFFLGLLYSVFIHNDIQIQTATVTAILTVISFLIAHSFLVNKIRSIRLSVNVLAVIFLIHGGVFTSYTVILLTGGKSNIFDMNIIHAFPILEMFVASILWTLGLIIMLNQRLNAEMSEVKEDLQLIFNASPDLALITRLEDGLIVEANEGFLRSTGYSSEEIVGKLTSEINIWKNLRDRHEIVNLVKEQGHCENFEARFVQKGGREFVGLMSAKMISLQGVPHLISNVRDITERANLETEGRHLLEISERSREALLSILEDQKQVQESLRESEEKFSVAFMSAPYAIAITRLEDGKFIEINDAFITLSGYTREEILSNSSIGMRLWVDEDNRNHVMSELMNNRKISSVEFTFRRKNGSILTTLYSAQFVRIHDKSYILSSVNDITERKRAEEALKKSSKLWQTTFDGIKDAIFLINSDGIITKSNKISQKFFNKKDEEIIGHHCFEVVHNSHCKIDSCPLGRMLNSKQREMTLYQVDEKWFETIIDPILDENNNVTSAVHIITDITEQKQTDIKINEQLDELRRWYEATLNRENRVLELKQEVNELLAKVGEPVRYVCIDSENMNITQTDN